MPAAVFAAVAVWLSSGTLAFRGPSGARIGALPLSAALLATAIVVAAIVFAAGRQNSRGAAIAVSPLLFVIVPWLPLPLPSAFLIWTGALAVPIWIGVALALVCAGSKDPAYGAVRDRDVGDVGRVFRPGGARSGTLAFAAGCVAFGLAAWFASPSIPGGDEPHYLVITQSLLHDHDLDVGNNYANGDYREYYGGPLHPDFRVRGRHGQLYSIHAPGVPALVLPAFALGGYHAVVVFLIAISAAACALAWWLAWRATKSASAAWFGWAAVALASPFLLESFTVYPDAPGAALVLTAFWALQRLEDSEPSDRRLAPWVWHGAALAALPWLHTRFALLAAVLGVIVVVRLLRTDGTRVAAFLLVPIVSAAAWIAAAYVMYGTPNPAAAYGGQSDTALAFLPNGFGGLLFDQGFGLIATAPVLIVAFAGLARTRRFAVEWGVTALVYGAAVASYAMWWAGTSGPARFLVPLLLPLSIPAACAWQAAVSRASRLMMTFALLLTAWLSAVMTVGGGGLLGYHSRNVYGMTAAPWIEWANPLVPLAQALPAFVPRPGGTVLSGRMTAAADGFATTVPWALSFAAAVYFIIWLGRKRGVRPYEIAAASITALTGATMIAASIGWWMHGGHRVAAMDAQLDVIRRLAAGHVLAVDLQNARVASAVDDLKMRVEVPVDENAGSPAAASIPLLPAGAYVLTTRGVPRTAGEIFAGADDEPFPLATATPADWARGITLELPVAVRAVTVRFAGSAGISAIDVRPMRRAAVDDRVARHAARFGDARVFVLDDRTTPESDGFWIWGAREGAVLFDVTGHDLRLVVRNGAAANEVTVRTAGREQHVTLSPGEQQPVAIPAMPADRPSVTTIRTSAGFRPADVDPHSRDRRFLGVYVVMPDHAGR